MRKSSRYLLPLCLVLFALLACTGPIPVPLGLEGTNVSGEMDALRETQAAINYFATQTPFVATQQAQQTQTALQVANQPTLDYLNAQGTETALKLTENALQVFNDDLTATVNAQHAQGTHAAGLTATADLRTQTAFEVQGTETQRAVEATATEQFFITDRKARINGVIAWTPVFFTLGIVALLWRFVIIAENRKSVFETPSGEMIFSRKLSVFTAALRVLLRRILPEISFDDFTMPGRAVGHSMHEEKEGYTAKGSPHTETQLRVITQEQIRRYYQAQYPHAPALPMPETPMYLLPGEVEVLPSNANEIQTWITDVEDQTE